MTEANRPSHVLLVKWETTTPTKEEIIMIPSMPMLVASAFWATEQPSVANRMGAVTVMTVK